jgi:hypothetical protein
MCVQATTIGPEARYVVHQGVLYLAGVGPRGWAWWTPLRGEAHPYDAVEADRLARAIRGEVKGSVSVEEAT